MEIERKFLVKELPDGLEAFPHTKIEQAYLCTDPVVRVRQDGDTYYMTYKGRGKMVREEYNLPLNEEAYQHLLEKADGNIISKMRYRIPMENGLLIELDQFFSPLQFWMAEVEFETEEQANAFVPPAWFGDDVTEDTRYHNSNMSKLAK